MKADEFAFGFDTMTLGVISMQILRIVLSTIDRACPGEAYIHDEAYTCFAFDAFLSSSFPRDPFYGVAGTRPEAWSLIQQIIKCLGNLSYTRAVADQRIAALPRNPANEAEFASTAATFGGPNSPESPNDWINLLLAGHMSILRWLPSSRRRNKSWKTRLATSSCRTS